MNPLPLPPFARMTGLVPFVLAAALMIGIWAPVASAQTPPDQLAREVVGPYEITVSAQPPRPMEGLGAPRFRVTVVTALSRSPVTDAVARISLKRPDGTEAGEVELNQNPIHLHAYEARLTLEAVGVWPWTVAVESPLGLELVEGAIEVVSGPSSGKAGTVAWGILMGIILAGGAFGVYKLRPKERRQP